MIARKNKISVLLLPPVLGLNTTRQYVEALKPDDVFLVELLANPPSVPGHRLQAALDSLLKKKEISVLNAEAKWVESSKSKIDRVHCQTGTRQEVIEADNFILATGKFVGGGLFAQSGFKESLLGLPVFQEEKPITCTPEFPVVNPEFGKQHNIFSLGIKVDSNLRPLSENRTPVFENLKAAGAVIGGTYPFLERCGMGLGMISGYISAI